jgi:hypothetical protein
MKSYKDSTLLYWIKWNWKERWFRWKFKKDEIKSSGYSFIRLNTVIIAWEIRITYIY